MKKYIVISHSDGLFIHVVAQFDILGDATQFAKLAAIGEPKSQFVVYEQK